VVPLQQPFQRFPEILQQMPAIGDLDGLRGSLARTVRVGTGAIPADDLHSEMIEEPPGERRGLAPQQEVDGTMRLHVHEDRPVGPPFAPTPIVHAENLGRAGVRQCRRHHRTQEGDTTDWDTELGEQACAGRTTDGDAEDDDDRREASRALAERSGDRGQPFGEDPACAGRVVTEPTAGMQLHPNRDPLPW